GRKLRQARPPARLDPLAPNPPYHWQPQSLKRSGMLVLIGVAFALSANMQLRGSHTRPTVVHDSTADSTTHNGRRRVAGIRRAVTAEVLATAYKDQTAKTTLLAARSARSHQDSALVAYDAMSYSRISAGM